MLICVLGSGGLIDKPSPGHPCKPKTLDGLARWQGGSHDA